MSTEYIVLCGQVVGGNGRPFEIVHNFDGERFADRKRAISHGFEIRGSDDFNIGVIRDGRLVSVDWMDKPIGEDEATIREIEAEIGIRS